MKQGIAESKLKDAKARVRDRDIQVGSLILRHRDDRQALETNLGEIQLQYLEAQANQWFQQILSQSSLGNRGNTNFPTEGAEKGTMFDASHVGLPLDSVKEKSALVTGIMIQSLGEDVLALPEDP